MPQRFVVQYNITSEVENLLIERVLFNLEQNKEGPDGPNSENKKWHTWRRELKDRAGAKRWVGLGN
jgi:hypothetical protein